MNVLLIHTHPSKERSFTSSIKDEIEKVVKDKGHQIEVRDLYQMNFNPVLTAEDLNSLQQNKIPQDIADEQKKIKEADLLIFIYPIWWGSMPAILKGYIDKVFSLNFAYKYVEHSTKGLLTGKKVLLFNSTGAPPEIYKENGIYDAIINLTDDNIFKFCGIEVLEHFFFSNIMGVSSEEIERFIKESGEHVGKYLKDNKSFREDLFIE